ncbi:LLM class flavin-dependent oxidoreductase [Sphaerisporangium album]|uniref:LLM class flavin-dependent oxidoreductase n=1 Tax=Sphaerisporangium album TaxID=509200 RepID=A0A367FCI3_9ACTN|nr:LLM class flavin-dependent oxidoreductase [Sphaerisporangium album]RCG27397.1 LLM class flavin-dependent oxidoreductase [Sphaerisporangium album]
MRIGVFLLAAAFPGRDHGEVLTAAVDTAVAAERAGFDDVWIAEHHFMSYGVCPSATTLAGYVLGRTERIGVGTAVSVLSSRHPIALAEEAALLDRVSGGRFRLGVGRGGPWVDLEVFGTGLDRFENGFTESLDLLVAALTRPTVSADGAVFRFREVEMVPRPGGPLLPVVAATSASTARLAASRGLPLLLGMHVGDEEKAALVEDYARAATTSGRDPSGAVTTDGSGGARGVAGAVGIRGLADVAGVTVGDVGGAGKVGGGGHVAAGVAYVADSTGEAVAAMRESLPRWLAPGLAGYRPVDDRPYRPRDAAEYAELLCRLHPVGSPAHCADTMITTIRRTGVRHLILLVEGAGDPARTRENVARLGAEVLPVVREAFRLFPHNSR